MDDAEFWVIRIIVGLVFGGACAAVAASKGRNAVGWFFLGVFFGCISLIIVACLSNLKEEAAKWSANEIEQRRLREQLRQEQMKNETLRQHTVARLDAHDQQLGVDTRLSAPALGMGAPSQPAKLLTGNPGTPPPGVSNENWYSVENGEQNGPYTFALLVSRARQGTLSPDTFVWAEGMDEWTPASQVQGLFLT